MPCLSILPAGHKGTPCANTLRQQVCGVIHKSPGRPRLDAPLHAGEKPSRLGSDQSALTEGDACARQNEPRSRHVVEEQRLLRGMDAPHARGSENLGSLWQSSSRPLRLRRQLSLPNLFHKEHRCPGPRVAQPSALCVPSNRSATAGTQTSQGTTAQASSNSPPLEEPAVGVRIIPAARGSPLAYSLETGPPLSSKRHAMASTARVMGPACVAAQREPFDLPERVLNTMAEARAPSTRRLYALKWAIFSAWCQDRDVDPVTSDVSVVLSFLQEMLDKQRSSSTIKVYPAAIAAFHAPIAGQSVGRNSAVVQFIRGARRMNPPRPRTVPPWDLPTVLRALKGPPVEPLQSTSLRSLSFKTALLLALASVKRVGDLQALSVNPACLEFGPNDSKVILKPRLGYVPKVLSTPFRAQVIALSALSPSMDDQELSLLCPVRALRVYIERSASYRRSEHLFVGFGNRAKGRPVTKQRISR